MTSTGENPPAEALGCALVTATDNATDSTPENTTGSTGAPLTFTLANENGLVDLDNYVYGLQSRKKDGADEGDGELEWFLAPKKDAGPDASSQTLSPSAAAALAFSGSGSQVSQYLHGLSDLRKRMGDVRRTASDGLYAGMRGGKDRIEGYAATAYRDQYRVVGLGLDRKVGENWIVGGAFEALEGNQTTRSNGASASGKSSGQNLRLYATWFADNGVYADIVAGVGRFNQKLSTKMARRHSRARQHKRSDVGSLGGGGAAI